MSSRPRTCIFNFNEWLKPETKSSILGLWEGFLKPEGVQKVDDHTVKLMLDGAKLDVPETLFHYPAQIMHRSFNGDLTTLKNPGTGPMKLDEFKVGERVVVSKRDGYWQNGADGKPLPYLDGIEYIDLGNDQTAYVAALQSGQIDTIYDPTVDTYLALKDKAGVVIEPITTSQVRVLRMRVDQDPWKDNKVRQAFKLTQDREASWSRPTLARANWAATSTSRRCTRNTRRSICPSTTRRRPRPCWPRPASPRRCR